MTKWGVGRERKKGGKEMEGQRITSFVCKINKKKMKEKKEGNNPERR